MNPTDKGPALEDSITLSNWNEIPYISCIELPCYIKSNSTGVAMLGGDNALHQHVHKQAQRIPLMLSAPGSERDPLRPPIVGQLRPCQGIVIKLIRRVIKDANGSVLSSRLVGAAAVGKLDRSYQFTAPADFQFLSAPTGCPLMCPASGLEVLETIPRPFSRRDPNELTVPLFEEFEVKIRNRKNISNQRALVVALKMTNDVVIPTEPTQDILDALQMSRRGPHRRVSEEPVIQLLKILFKDRPMWSIMGLFGLSCLNNLNSANERIVQQLLAHVAYRVGQPGAWHGTHAGYSYDPRIDPKSRWMQGIGFKIKESFIRELHQRVADCIDTKGIIRIHIESGLAECQASADLAAVENNPLDLVGEGISTIRNIRVVPISAFVKKRADETSRKKDITAKPKLMFCGYKLKRTNRMQICDVMDENFIQEVTKSVRRLEQPTERDGWFAERTIERMRDLIILCFKRRAGEFLKTLEEYQIIQQSRIGIDTSTNSTCAVNGYLQSELSYAESARNDWFKKYMSIPDAIVTGEELADTALDWVNGENLLRKRSYRDIISSKPHKRRKGLENEAASLMSKTSANSIEVNNALSLGSSYPSQGFNDVEAFTIFDDNASGLDNESENSEYEEEYSDDDEIGSDEENSDMGIAAELPASESSINIEHSENSAEDSIESMSDDDDSSSDKADQELYLAQIQRQNCTDKGVAPAPTDAYESNHSDARFNTFCDDGSIADMKIYHI